MTTEKGSLNLRKSDSTASTVLTTIPRNATIPILQRGYSWSKTTYGGFTGYVMNKYLRFNDGSTPTPIPVVTPIPGCYAYPAACANAHRGACDHGERFAEPAQRARDG